MRRPMLMAIAGLALLGGCESYGDLTPDAFDPGDASQTRFTMDSAQCQVRADNVRSYQIEGITATHTERHELYNKAFTDCMRAAGYARRGVTPNLPYEIDPFPG